MPEATGCNYPNCPDHAPEECAIAYHESGACYDMNQEDYEDKQREFCTAQS